MALLEASGIGKDFGETHVLKDISLTLEQGEALAIIGSSGSGPPKSSSFSVRVVLPASGCAMTANVRRRVISSCKVIDGNKGCG